MRRPLLLLLALLQGALLPRSCAGMVGTTLVVIGGGAAGYFGAISAAQAAKDRGKELKVVIVEQLGEPLTKVKISGGGRCNVLHDETKTPLQISMGYPRGSKELIGPLASSFGAPETAAWFRQRGVELKTERDGRMFPITDDSQTVITCLVSEANKMGVRVLYGCKATLLAALPQGAFSVDIVGTLASSKLMDGLQVLDGPDPRHQTLVADRVLVATGGSKTAHVWAAALGHKIDPVVPSLFTFKSHDARLKDLAGVSVQDAEVSLILPKPAASAADLDSDSAGSTPDKKRKKKPPARRRSPPGLIQRGPLLVTHEGLSGPSILRLSAFAARELNACGYKGAMVKINFVPNLSSDAQKQVLDMIRRAKTDHARKEIGSFCPVQGVDLPRRLWRSIVTGMGISPETRWADCPKSALVQMANSITGCEVLIAGRGLYKDEFVCCGGVSLASLNMRTMESRAIPGLYFAGEVIAVDGVTGGFNLQSAWTTGWVAGCAVADSIV